MTSKILIFLCGLAAGICSLLLFSAVRHPSLVTASDEAVLRQRADAVERLHKLAENGEARQAQADAYWEKTQQRDAQIDESIRKDRENEERFSSVLDTWQVQQREYQQYLDGLKGKSL